MAWSVTPAIAPRQPAWAAPTTPVVGVRQQDRGAVCRHHAQQQAGTVGDERIGMGPLRIRQSFTGDDRGGGMDLVHAGERSAWNDGIGGEAAVGLDRRRIVAAPESAVQPGDNSLGNAPGPSEKPVRHAVQRRSADDVEAHSFSRMTMSSSA
jgi:hypothetical protein